MASIVGYIGLIGIDSESGNCAHFCLVHEPGSLNVIKIGDSPAWFCIDLQKNGREAGRRLLQEVYLAHSNRILAAITFDKSQPELGVLGSGCFHVSAAQILRRQPTKASAFENQY